MFNPYCFIPLADQDQILWLKHVTLCHTYTERHLVESDSYI